MAELVAPTVVNLKKSKYDLYIGRENKWKGLLGSKWGNPFFLKNEGQRPAVLASYFHHLRDLPELLNALGELNGLTLGCWCKPKTCHGDVLVRLFRRYVLKIDEPLDNEYDRHLAKLLGGQTTQELDAKIAEFKMGVFGVVESPVFDTLSWDKLQKATGDDTFCLSLDIGWDGTVIKMVTAA